MMPAKFSEHSTAFLKLLGFIVSLLLIFSGTLILRTKHQGIGFLLLVIGLAGFLGVSYVLKKSPLNQTTLALLKSYKILATCWVIAATLIIWIIYRLALRDQIALIPAWILWLASLFLLIVGALGLQTRARFSRAGLKTWWKTYGSEVILVAMILIVGFAVRAQSMTTHPYPWSGDEASVGIEARHILYGDISELFATGWSGQPYWSFVPTTISIAIFGENITAIRMVSITAGTLTILTLYLFCRELFSIKVATIAAIFMIAFPYHVHFSRIGVSNIFDGLNVTLALWLVYRAITKNQLLDYTLAGIATGFALYTYVGSRLVLLMVVGVFIYAAIIKRGYLRNQWVKIVAFGFSAMLTIAPIGYYFSQNPDNFMTRIGQEGILLNGWLAAEAGRSGTSIIGVLLEQITKSTLVFTADRAWSAFYYSPEPFLSLLGSIFFLIGMAYAFWRIKELRYVILLGWFWSVVLFGGVLTTNPPSSTRMLMTSPAIAVFLALGLDQVGKVFGNLNISPKRINILTGVMLCILSLQGYYFYFGDYKYGHFLQDANSELGMEAGLQLSRMDWDCHYYLFGSPRVFVDFPTTIFVAPYHLKTDLTTDMIDEVDISDDGVSFFVAIPENKADLERIEERFPDGEWETINRKTETEVLFYSYTIFP